MPELPEVETVCQGLRQKLVGQRVEKCVLNRMSLRFPIPPILPKLLAGQRVSSVARRAKYALLHLENGHTVILHLGMSGRLVFAALTEPVAKHDHVEFHFSQEKLVLNDPRRFGAVDVTPTAQLATHKLLAALGPEPLEEAFNARYLQEKCAGKKSPIKNVIMDARVVVGVGNIYASEALFAARILPTRPAGKLRPAECARLVATVQEILQKAITAGGSSLNDYVQTDGSLGYFQHQFQVYGREKAPCRMCKAPVQKSIIGQRSSFYCPCCQA